MARANDDVILEWAVSNNRILITLDSDFGDWAVLPLLKQSGVIRVKARPATTQSILDILTPFLKKHDARDFIDKLVILSRVNARWIHTGYPLA